MKRKQSIAYALITALLCTALFAPCALAIDKSVLAELRGLVTEVIDNGLVIQDPQQGEVLINIDPDTVLEGVLAEKPLAVGMYVLVKFNGNLTRTNPPQARADRLACYPLEGIVEEVLPEGILLSGDPIFGEVIVNLSGTMPLALKGVPITVYYDGAMAMSLPGRVSARHIVVPVLKGTVKSVGADSLVLDAGEESRVTVHLAASSLLPASFFDGSINGRSIVVYYDGQRDGSQITALEILDPASIVEASMPLIADGEEEADGEEALLTPEAEETDEAGEPGEAEEAGEAEETEESTEAETPTNPQPTEDTAETEEAEESDEPTEAPSQTSAPEDSEDTGGADESAPTAAPEKNAEDE